MISPAPAPAPAEPGQGLRPAPAKQDERWTSYYIGLDLGQAVDHSAITVVERRITQPNDEVLYLVRNLRRYPLRTAYPDLVRRVGRVLSTEPLVGRCALIVDGTGVGRPVVDAFRAAGLSAPVIPVLITGGDAEVREHGWWRVPKRNLAGAVAVLLQTERLKLARGLVDGPLLMQELANFRVRIDPATAHDSYSAWREGQHDDLVLATALACWAGERGIGQDRGITSVPYAIGSGGDAGDGDDTSDDELMGELGMVNERLFRGALR